MHLTEVYGLAQPTDMKVSRIVTLALIIVALILLFIYCTFTTNFGF